MGLKKKIKKKTKKAIRTPFKKWKELLLLIVIAFFCIVALELITPPIYKAMTGMNFSKEEIRARLGLKDAVRQGELAVEEEGWASTLILHPYLGFTNDYSREPDHNRFGFRGPEPLLQGGAGKVIVAITGGSFAREFYSASKDTLAKGLNSIPALAGKKIEVLCLALGGFKQPQQFMALSYFLSLGAQFDIVINIDGFNEVALPYGENVPDGIYPFYPRLWKTQSLKRIGAESIRMIGRLDMLREERTESKRLFSRWPLRNRNFSLAVWDRLDQRNVVAQVSLQKQISDSLYQRKPSPQVTGPFRPYPDDAALFRDLVRVWRNSSVQLDRLSSANGIRYFHFLQPNQYVRGSKPFSREEAAAALKGGEPHYKAGAEGGYDLLIESGAGLRKELTFTDLTMLFKDEPRTLYRDNCCHLNELGYDLISEEIVRVISKGSG